MIRRHVLVALLAAAPFAALAEYPDKPMTFVVPFAAGKRDRPACACARSRCH